MANGLIPPPNEIIIWTETSTILLFFFKDPGAS